MGEKPETKTTSAVKDEVKVKKLSPEDLNEIMQLELIQAYKRSAKTSRTKESRHIQGAVRTLTSLRVSPYFTTNNVLAVVQKVLGGDDGVTPDSTVTPEVSKAREEFLGEASSALLQFPGSQWVEPEEEEVKGSEGTGMEVEEEEETSVSALSTPGFSVSLSHFTVDSELFLRLLVATVILDAGWRGKFRGANPAAVPVAAGFLNGLLERSAGLGEPRTSAHVVARAWFLVSRAVELSPTTVLGSPADLIPRLQLTLRGMTLSHNREGEAVVLVTLLRFMVICSNYVAAAALLTKVTLPETASNGITARFLYYSGRVDMVQLDYGSARKSLMQALQKCGGKALGFKVEVIKALTLCCLLTGDMPERSLFTNTIEQHMGDYSALVECVGAGEVSKFNELVESGKEVFSRDGFSLVVQRLRHTVLRTALRNLSLAYSRVPLATVAEKLSLPSATDAAHVVAKAVKDGVIVASIDPETECVVVDLTKGSYESFAPREALGRRIVFLGEVREAATRALRFGDDAHVAQHKSELSELLHKQLQRRAKAKGIDTKRASLDDA